MEISPTRFTTFQKNSCSPRFESFKSQMQMNSYRERLIDEYKLLGLSYEDHKRLVSAESCSQCLSNGSASRH